MGDRVRRARWGLTLLPAAGLAAVVVLRAATPLAAAPPPPSAAKTPAAKVAPAATSKTAATKTAAKGAAKTKATTMPAPTPETETKAEPKVREKVKVGVYLKELPDIDVKSNQYTADFYIWFRWKGDIDPTETFEFVNGIEPNDTSKVAIYTSNGQAHADTLDDGSKYQVFHIQGKFSHPFNLKDYPFDEQDVVLEMEDVEYSIDQLVYEADHDQTASDPHIVIPGWDMKKAALTISESTYKTNFGDPRVTPGQDSYSRFTFGVHLARPIMGYMVKTILPIAIVILITFVAFLIHSSHFEARIGLVITSLISAVALQLTAGNDLPSIGYLVLLDKVYNISYAVILLTLVESVISVALHDREKDSASVMLDRIALVVCFLIFFGGVGLMIALR